jgi:hypothetical protein
VVGGISFDGANDALTVQINVTDQCPVSDALAGSEDKREQECYN